VIRTLIHLGVGLVLSGLIGAAAYRRGSLTKSGVYGAILVGTAIFGFGGWVWGMLLITFFALSSLLSHFHGAVKANLAEKFAKGHRRDLGQALANGGAGALIAAVSAVYPHPAMFVAYVGAMAAVNADTWATELGVLSKRLPRLVTTWRPVEPGTSGGISALGTWAATAGAATIGLATVGYLAVDGLFGGAGVAAIGAERAWGTFQIVLVAALSGLFGATFDSLLGATVQAIYYDPRRCRETEKHHASDGRPNVHRRGWRWLGNDHVNLFSSFVGAAVATLVWYALQ
jgi:uncharacterized protein (TIGR00297 family)